MSAPRRTPAARSGPHGGHDAWWLALLGVCSAAALAVWVAGGLLAWERTGRFREVRLVAAPALLVRLVVHPGDPRLAWPATLRAGLPGTAAVDATLTAALVLVGLGAGALGWQLSTRGATTRPARRRGPGRPRSPRPRSPRPRRRPPPTGEGGWATTRDLRSLEVPGAPGDRIVLGRMGRRLIAAEAGHSLLVVGPTQSGKTSGLAIPAILEWSGPVLATSVKADLVRDTIGWRTSIGEVHCYDPTGTAGVVCSGWSPLRGASTWSGARRVASALCSVGRVGDGGMDDAGFWYANAEKLLAPLLFAAATVDASMSDVVRWLDTEEVGEVLLGLELAGVPDALRAARACFAREERQRASVYATAETVVAAYCDPAVAASALTTEIDPAALVSGGSGTLYCCAPAREQERLAPVFTCLVREVVDAAFQRSATAGRPLDPPLLVVLDEAANIAPMADLDRLVATAAGHGVQLVTVWQDLAQAEARYGVRWATVANNHRAKLVCSGIADPVTLGHLSGLLGDEERPERSRTVGEDGRWSRTETVATRPLAPSGSLRQIPPGEAVLVYGSLPPARVALRPWFEEQSLRSRAGTHRRDAG